MKIMTSDYYYEKELKGKSAEEILNIIKDLRQTIDRLKLFIENIRFLAMKDITLMCSEKVLQLAVTREYLQVAIQAFEDTGNKYCLTRSEQKAKKFDDNIEHIQEIEFSLGGFFEGYEKYKIIIEDSGFNATKTSFDGDLEIQPIGADKEPIANKCDLLDAIRKLYIGEWLPNYDPERFGVHIMDGTSWELTVKYDNGVKPFKSSGDNDYPWNFANLLRFFGIER